MRGIASRAATLLCQQNAWRGDGTLVNACTRFRAYRHAPNAGTCHTTRSLLGHRWVLCVRMPDPFVVTSVGATHTTVQSSGHARMIGSRDKLAVDAATQERELRANWLNSASIARYQPQGSRRSVVQSGAAGASVPRSERGAAPTRRLAARAVIPCTLSRGDCSCAPGFSVRLVQTEPGD